MMKPEQPPLFDDVHTDAERAWQGMPEFTQEDLRSESSLKLHFRNDADREAFGELVGQPITSRTRALWYPPAEIGRYADRAYVSDDPDVTTPIYPIYIISKGRADSRLTAKALDAIGVPYRIVVEPQEFEEYAAVIPEERILELPFSNLGRGSIPARNWVWEHSRVEGAARHWILDDNIRGFFRLHRNLKTPVGDGAIFQAAEEFVDRYKNVALAGMNYFMFAPRKNPVPALYLNTRIYSCILIDNATPFRWRGRYNEDTDLSLRVLKSGLCTALFNAFLCRKSQTMTMTGGNTDQLYAGDGRRAMADSLVEQHPDVTKVVWKWGRWQHEVDYRRFRTNKLKLRDGVSLDMFDASNDFGMSLKFHDEGETDELDC